MRPMALAVCWANQMLPSEPVVIPATSWLEPGTAMWVTMAPAVVITPTMFWPETSSVNHRLPSGPAVMPKGTATELWVENSVITPAVVMRPTRPPTTFSVNHRLLSGPTTMAQGLTLAVGTGNDVTALSRAPLGLSLPMALADWVSSVNHMLPSGPATMPAGSTQPAGQLVLAPPGTLK